MKKFRFRYSATVWTLLVLVLILSVTGLFWNILNLIEYSFLGALKTVTYSLMVLMTAVLSVLVLSIMIYGRYVIKNGDLLTFFGFFKSKTKISEIVQVTHFKKSDKLVLYFIDQKYTVVVISKEDYERFILALREVNRAIVYTSETDGEDTPE